MSILGPEGWGGDLKVILAITNSSPHSRFSGFKYTPESDYTTPP